MLRYLVKLDKILKNIFSTLTFSQTLTVKWDNLANVDVLQEHYKYT